MADQQTALRWPEGYEPEGAAFHAVNRLEIDAPRERVWAWLARPDLWPSYYPNSRLVRHLEGPWPEVELGSRFRWLTFGALITSEIVECEPTERIAWNAKGIGSRGHHGWLLEKRRGGCRLVTEETQRGWGIRLVRPALRPLMLRYHQRWLEGLARVAAEGDPPPPG